MPAERPEEAQVSVHEDVTCALCGMTTPSLPLGWSTSVERGRTAHHCDGCSREHVRSMEAKLDPEHW